MAEADTLILEHVRPMRRQRDARAIRLEKRRDLVEG